MKLDPRVIILSLIWFSIYNLLIISMEFDLSLYLSRYGDFIGSLIGVMGAFLIANYTFIKNEKIKITEKMHSDKINFEILSNIKKDLLDKIYDKINFIEELIKVEVFIPTATDVDDINILTKEIDWIYNSTSSIKLKNICREIKIEISKISEYSELFQNDINKSPKNHTIIFQNYVSVLKECHNKIAEMPVA